MSGKEQKKKILIVGAGSSGLSAIKACLEEGQHLIPVCLEKTLDIGGLWNYSEQPSAPGTAGIYDSLVINTCKEMTAFSDFPVPSHFPHFLPHRHVMTYFRMYADHFRLLPHIRFNTEVRHIRPADDYDITGRWTVTYIKHVGEACPMKCVHLDFRKERDLKTVGSCGEGINDKEDKDNQGKAKDADGRTGKHKRRTQDSVNRLEEANSKDTAIKLKLTNGLGKAYRSKSPEKGKKVSIHCKTSDLETVTNHIKPNGLDEKSDPKDYQGQEVNADKPKDSNIMNGLQARKSLFKASDRPAASSSSSSSSSSFSSSSSSSEEDTTKTLLAEIEKANKEQWLPETEGTNVTAKKLPLQETSPADKAVLPEAERANEAAPPEAKTAAARPLETKMANINALPQKVEDDSPQNQGACQEVMEDYDGVMICTGHHTVPYMPEFPGRAQFRGQILHSQDYKRPEAFKDLCVLIIGMGNSAVDIASDLAKTARQVYLSTRRGSWVLSRSWLWGVPADMLANSRLVISLPTALLQWCVERQANLRLDHHLFGLRPKHRVLGAHPTFHEELPYHLMTRRVEVRPDVSRILPHAVTFIDGSQHEVDVIIMATGYDYRLDFVDPNVLKVIDNRVHLYKFVFPPRLPHATLAVIGLVQAIGAVMPIAELQSRWFVGVITGRVSLPDRAKMEKDIAEKEKEMNSRYYSSRRHTLQAFWVQYMDEVAGQLGVRPNLWWLLLTSPSLALRCYLGPCLPAQYRLQGPHSWPQASRFIRSVWSRYADAYKPKSSAHSNLADISPTITSAASLSTGPSKDDHHQESLDEANTAHITENLRRHRMTSQKTVNSESSTSATYLFPPSLEGREEGESVLGRCRGVAFYLYLLLLALACVVWLVVRVLGPRQEVCENLD